MGDYNIFHREIDGALSAKPRIFISHRLGDKNFATAVASYFERIGLHYYFDEQDELLNEAVQGGHNDDLALVHAIERGLAHSSHLLAVLSRRTMGSWWVPYEIGCARASGKDIRHLLLPTITSEMIPEYLRIYPQLWKAQDLFDWVSAFTPWRGHLVNREYREYLSDIFGELDPDEETVEEWFMTADRENHRYLADLDVALHQDF